MLTHDRQYVLGGGGTNPTAEVRHTFQGLDTPATVAPYGALKRIEMQRRTNPLLVSRDRRITCLALGFLQPHWRWR